MKKIMCFMVAFAMIFALLTNSVQAAETGVLPRVSGEDFTGLVIAEATGATQSLALSGTNGLKARNMRVNNAAVSVLSDGLGGKPKTDKYLRVSRNGGDNLDYYFFLALKKGGYHYTTGNPVTVSFSVYAPEDLGDDSFLCQFGPEKASDKNSPIGVVYFVTNEGAVVDGKGVLWDQRFLVTVGEWNRISVTMYPNTKKTDVVVNGKYYTFDVINQSRTYGEYLNTLKVALPTRAGKNNEFLACDDFVIYNGAGMEKYTAPTNALTADKALVGEDSVYISGEFDENDFSVPDGELCVMNDTSNKPVKLAVWVNNNPIPKYYDIKTVADDEVVALSLTADKAEKTFTARGFANGAAGTVIVAEYTREGEQLLGAQVYNITGVAGKFEKKYSIKNYDSSKSYKSFWWDFPGNMKPFLGCEFF